MADKPIRFGIIADLHGYLKAMQRVDRVCAEMAAARKKQRRERAWLTGGIIAAAALILGTALGAFYATGAW